MECETELSADSDSALVEDNGLRKYCEYIFDLADFTMAVSFLLREKEQN